MDSKQIKHEILMTKYSEDKIDKYLYMDFKNTFVAIINSIYVILSKSNYSKLKLDSLINKLEVIVREENDKDRLIFIKKKINDLIVRIDKHLPKSRYLCSSEILKRIRSIVMEIDKNSNKSDNEEIVKLLEKIIYEEKNLVKLGKIIRRQRDLFKDRSMRIIFENLLYKYIELDYRTDEALYYFNIICLILSSENRLYILIDKDKYLEILSKHKKNKGVSMILSKMDKDYTTSLNELGKRYDIAYEFKRNMMYNGLLNNPITKHLDMTNFPSIAIDDEGNQCNDDAFCLYKNYDGTYTLRIDISSVPAIIRYGSYLDRQAYKRAETIYLSNGEIPMYPDYISFDRGSLLENNTRYVLSYFYRVDSNFDLIEDSFEVRAVKTKIAYNLSHEQANLLLKGNYNDPLSIMLKNLSYVASKMNNGSKQIIDSKSLVHNFMVLPNKSISVLFKRLGYPFIYRVHRIPDKEIKEDIKRQYCDFINDNLMCQKILKIIENNYEEGMYSCEPEIHMALGLETYGNITKPLRNYPSAIDEYIIYDTIINNNIDNKNLYNWEETLKEMTIYINNRIRLNKLFQSEYEALLVKNKIRKK